MQKTVPVRHQGNENLFLAVEMSLISTLAGVPLHVHAEGLRGTGKTTVMRWAKQMVPKVRRISGCPYQCDPERPRCPKHSAPESAGVDAAATEVIPMPFVEIGHGAKLGTILGSIDLARLTGAERPEAVLLPGSIPMANRGIIFVDEVNRLAETAPEITDVLLSVMGTKPGIVKIEEVGLPPCEIEISSSVWAASNPDEDPGPLEDIRKQLADRFDLVVPVQRPSDPAIVENLLMGHMEDRAVRNQGDAPMADLDGKAARLAGVKVPQNIIRYMAQLYTQRNVESLRAVEALELSSRLFAVMQGRAEVCFDDVLAVIPLVLRHRVEPAVLAEILKDLELRRAAGAQARSPAPAPPNRDQTKPGGRQAPDGRREDDLGKPGAPQDPAGDDAASRSGTGNGVRSQAGSGQGNDEPGSGLRDHGPDGSRRDASGSGGVDIPQGPGRRESGGNWLERLLRRYRKPVASNSSAPGQGRTRGREGGSSSARTSSAPQGKLPDPTTIPPASPPDKARRISTIPWDEIVVPPEWKNGSP